MKIDNNVLTWGLLTLSLILVLGAEWLHQIKKQGFSKGTRDIVDMVGIGIALFISYNAFGWMGPIGVLIVVLLLIILRERAYYTTIEIYYLDHTHKSIEEIMFGAIRPIIIVQWKNTGALLISQYAPTALRMEKIGAFPYTQGHDYPHMYLPEVYIPYEFEFRLKREHIRFEVMTTPNKSKSLP